MAEEKSAKPEWVKMTQKELDKIVIDLAKEGNSPAKIGIILRDKHSVPSSKVVGKKISKILSEAKVEIRKDKDIIDEKIKQLESHILKNKHDYTAQRSLTKNLWALNRVK